ncbi:hypothetical protein SAMN04244553_3942 [Nocardia amikacinitolerans]|uniref:SPW repeat-containing protein n=1 Tax=Nocardia amikacinitolerans TaxID=756689 RepID=A0A285LPZ5_9NOCA|nr:hypothetical protein [Nocardia amikacinitolerans]MCP2278944.1 hypothetical protein [Nocardia amikacinitolerans]MCP2300224.1 hypothetical protein [Nocardia amikacinitolerans]SNY87014.1 hypothetical protein SAMN04244553_3942 [Nocardia amikacinitolerans]
MTTATSPGYLSTLLAPGDKLLRTSLRLDAVITGANGIAYLALSGPLESLLGLDRGLGIAIGVFLTLYGLGVAAIGSTKSINPVAARAVIGLNAAWVLVSLVALVEGALDLTVVGSVWTVMQAATVGGFAALQYLGLRKTR